MNTAEQLNSTVRNEGSQTSGVFLTNSTPFQMLESPRLPPLPPVNTANVFSSSCMFVCDLLYRMLTMRKVPASNIGTPYATESVSVLRHRLRLSSDEPCPDRRECGPTKR